MVAAVDRTEPTFADELVDAKLAVEDLTDEPKRVGNAHGWTISPFAHAQRSASYKRADPSFFCVTCGRTLRRARSEAPPPP
jgi:hypothetical protein